MSIGALDYRCRIERPAVTGQDPDYGTDVIGWALVGVRWCGVLDTPPSISESVKNGLAIAKNQSRVRLRYCTDIDSSMRLIINRPAPTVYQIVGGPAEIGRHEGIEIVVEKFSS